jgi:outer membrane murein-binding lipoprotein Lpp
MLRFVSILAIVLALPSFAAQSSPERMSQNELRQAVRDLQARIAALEAENNVLRREWLADHAERIPLNLLEGRWSVRYTNGVTRTYDINDRGMVRFTEEDAAGEIGHHSNETFLTFDDGKQERLALAGRRLMVEHWDSGRGVARPTAIGVGERVRLLRVKASDQRSTLID